MAGPDVLVRNLYVTRTRPISIWFKKNRGNVLAQITENFRGNGFRHGWIQVTK